MSALTGEWPAVTAPAPGDRSRVDRVELAILIAFAALSCWVLVLDLYQVVVRGWDWTGTDGVFLVDQTQYLAWIQSASHHLLAANLFTLGHTPADFFEPLVAISGGLTAFGVAPWAALLLWKPVAVGGLLLASRAFVHRALPGSADRRWALLVGLFFTGWGAFLAERVTHAGLATELQLSAITSDLWLGFWSWGYVFGLISLAAVLGAIVTYDRARATRRTSWWPPLLGALAASTHPWQAGTLLLLLVGGEALAWRRGGRPHFSLLAWTLAGIAVPLTYFVLLDRFDPSWKLAQQSGRGSFPLWTIAVSIAPLALPAGLAYRRRAQSFLDTAIRLWLPAALVVFLFSETGVAGVPTHALLGLSLPLAVLAVDGVRSLPRPSGGARRLAVLGAAGALTLAAIVNEMSDVRRLLSPGRVHGQPSGSGDGHFIQPGERLALDYLSLDPLTGGVISRNYLGTLVPAVTGRRTYVGNPYFSPDYFQRIVQTDELFAGQLPAAVARRVVLSTGARFVLADCRTSARLLVELAPISGSARRFGCAAVLTVR